MTRGGVREGAGRPVGSKTKKELRKPSGQVNMRFAPELLVEIDRIADNQGISRTAWIVKTCRREIQKFRPR